ncbi:hypothetical protein Acid345_1615 [Candidatus Koribacter versatilis Ellin345]|uniref:Uncharacterized protein n=1 Tax=Koribacter versatilis (strain Ellin345) TaxID=204669 RepID=Q1IR83_KORVE|nr:hypothetical protein [Candidatus Koribacter versatilis]ABF40617.1 hypothetical protein Acid345_1615 [Candidatus Koribacter versatilis Ellin345]
MKRIVLGLSVLLALSGFVQAQKAAADANATQQVIVPKLIRFSGQLADENGKALTGTVGITFSLYKSQTDKASLWIETQNVKLDAEGKYGVLLGATKADGVPLEMFARGEARWLGMNVNGKEQPRVLFVSVPYALKAAEAESLAGHAATDFVTTDKLTTTVQEQVKQATSSSSTKDGATGNTVNPATSFAANNTTQVLDVTQSGSGTGVWSKATTGIALRGSSAGLAIYGSSTGTSAAPAIQGVSNSTAGAGVMGYNTAASGSPTGLYGLATGAGGIGLSAKATATTGATRGISVYTASPAGIAGLFVNAATSGNVITGQGGSPLATVFNVTTAGNVSASGTFTGNGAGLTNVNATKLGGVSLSGLPSLSAANTFTNQQYINTAKTNYALQVYNTSTSGSLGAAVTAFADNPNGIGLYGEADSGEASGVFGYTKSVKGAGVYGQMSKGSAIYGSCCAGYQGIGVWGDTGGTGAALLATADATDAGVMYNNGPYSTLYIENDYPSSKGTAYVLFAGNANNSGGCGIDTIGNLSCSGMVTGTVRGGGGQKMEMYGVQATENWYEDAGSSSLRNGAVTVQLDTDFAAAANTAVTYQVFLTPNGDCKGLYVANKGPKSFEVRELGGGTASIGFDYRIVAKRKGAETVRMKRVADNAMPVRNVEAGLQGAAGARSSLRPQQ